MLSVRVVKRMKCTSTGGGLGSLTVKPTGWRQESGGCVYRRHTAGVKGVDIHVVLTALPFSALFLESANRWAA